MSEIESKINPRIHSMVEQYVDVSKRPLEIVERKGRGHPDSITDAIASLFSSLYSKYTNDHLGGIGHHNVDKVVICGGTALPRFGGGIQIDPAIVDFVGRALRETYRSEDKTIKPIPLYDLARQSTTQIFARLAPNLKFVFETNKIKRGSLDLIENFEVKQEIPRANDTSFATAWAPLSPLEQLLVEAETYLNTEFRKNNPWLGADIKIMGRRMDEEIVLNVAAAFIDSQVDDAEDYKNKREKLRETVAKRYHLDPEKVWVNSADIDEKESFYITVTGLSIENGDDGAVGRGNRVTGVIAPYRPQTLEAIGGKNPTRHVGNFYNVWAYYIAEQISKDTGVPTTVSLVSTIGKPITDCDVFITTAEEVSLGDASAIAREVISQFEEITWKIINCDVPLYPFYFIPKE